MKNYLSLTKNGIVIFVLLTGLAGYALGFGGGHIQFLPILWTMLALYFLSAGSFIINQAQESRIDVLMPRTENRPIPQGKISARTAFILGLSYVLIGTGFSLLLNHLVTILGLATVLMYNGIYTLYFKRKLSFGAVPGAIPGGLSVVIGYAASSGAIFTSECVYAFLIMFLWQMPHFWSLAIKYKEDYQKGGIPVLPVALGTHATLFHIGLYVFAYLGLALASPWLTSTHYAYFYLVLPFVVMVGVGFVKYYRSEAKQGWLGFFMWTNFSMLAFLIAPVIDKWQDIF